MTYTFTDGFRARGIDPQVAGELFEQLWDTHSLTAEGLVDASRPEDAPLHKYFEWDDRVAAEEYRKEQARHIIAAIIAVPEPGKPPVRVFFNTDVRSPEYKPLQVILLNRDETEKLFQTALRELQSFRRKYAHLSRLTPVFVAIDQLKGD